MTFTASVTLINHEQDEKAYQMVNGWPNGGTKVNNWSEPGSAAFDFRSMY
jgi:hypothetical protein